MLETKTHCDEIIVQNLSKAFGSLRVLSGLSFVVPRGQVYGLIGPNGAGKTTTMRILAGLMVPDEGGAQLCGVDVCAEPAAAQRCLGWLNGSAGLYERLRCGEVLRYFGALYGLSRQRVQQRIEELAETLQFSHLLARRCRNLSTGERQRVALARAVIHDPQVVILDEPTAGLDIVASRFVIDFVGHLKASGHTLLLSTHYMTEAELLCDRVGLLHQGTLICEGTPAGVRHQTGAKSLEEGFLRLLQLEGGAR